MPVKILVVDDHEVIRTGLASLLSGDNLKVVAEASTSAQAVKLAGKHKPDVILLDLRLADSDGLEAIAKLKKAAPNAKVIILSAHENPTYVARAVACGASDYLLKSASRSELLTAISAAAAGKSPSSVGKLAAIAQAMAKREAVDVDDGAIWLTGRETQVLRHVALGLSNKEIGYALEISIETAKEHVQNLFRKLSVTHRTQAAVWALKRRLV